MRHFIGLVLADGEAAVSDGWRLTQAALVPCPGGAGLPAEGEPVARLQARAPGASEWLLVCSLTRGRPVYAFGLSLDRGACIACEVLDGAGVVVQVLGRRVAAGAGVPTPLLPGLEPQTLMHEEGGEEEVDAGEMEFPRRASELNAEREATRRRASLESVAGSTPSSCGTPRRIPRLTFNPHVLVAEYTPKVVGISPVRGVADLSQMEKRAVHRQRTELLLPLHPLVKPEGSAQPSQPLPLRQPTCSAARAVPTHSPSPARSNGRAGSKNGPSPGSKNGPSPGSKNGPSPGSINGPSVLGFNAAAALGAAEMQQRMTSLIAAEAGCMAAGRQRDTGGGGGMAARGRGNTGGNTGVGAEAARGGDSLERLAADLRRQAAAGGAGGDTLGGPSDDTGGVSTDRPLVPVFRLLLSIRSLALRGLALEAAEAIDDLQRACGIGTSSAARRSTPAAVDGHDLYSAVDSRSLSSLLEGRGLLPALTDACHALMQAVGPALASEGKLGGRARLAAVMQVDTAYFSLLYSELTHPAAHPRTDRLAFTPSSSHAASLNPRGGNPNHAASLSSGHGLSILRLLDPASFLRASHPPAFAAAAVADVTAPAHVLPPAAGWLQQAASALASFYTEWGDETGLHTEGGPDGPLSNPLLSLWRLRFGEASELLHTSGVASPAAYAKNSPRRSPSRDKEPAAPPLVRKWRRAEREWPCWMLAFAVPSEQALQAIAMLKMPVVEMGGGVGYWAELLRRRGVKVECYDSAPTTAAGNTTENRAENRTAHSTGGSPIDGRAAGEAVGGGNTFHGLNPPWGTVARGTAQILASKRFEGHALFLCYPPPRAPMAGECLQRFRGSVLIHVGEWLGDTGSPAFERALAEGWELRMRMPLPCWGDTVEDLTIWHRRTRQNPNGKQNPKRKPAAVTEHPTLKCDECGKPGTVQLPQKLDAPGVLRRCRYCRLACYCSQACAERGVAVHAAYHRLKMVGAPPPINLGGDEYHTVCV